MSLHGRPYKRVIPKQIPNLICPRRTGTSTALPAPLERAVNDSVRPTTIAVKMFSVRAADTVTQQAHKGVGLSIRVISREGLSANPGPALIACVQWIGRPRTMR